MGQLKPASPPVSPGAARPLFCPQSSGRSRWPILGDRGLRSRYLGQILLVLPPHPPLCTMGKKEATAWTTPPQRQKTCTAAPSPPGCRSCSLRGSQRAQHPREASRATPKKAGVPRGAPPPAPSEQPLASLLCTHAIWGPWTNLVLQAPHLQEDRPQPPKPRRECRSVTRWPEERSTPLHLPPPRPRPAGLALCVCPAQSHRRL